jgi:hypothetical protein
MQWPATAQQLIDAGYKIDQRPANCGSCRAVIFWTTTPAGKKMPIIGTGTDDEAGRILYQSHFADCPNAAAHRKAR